MQDIVATGAVECYPQETAPFGPLPQKTLCTPSDKRADGTNVPPSPSLPLVSRMRRLIPSFSTTRNLSITMHGSEVKIAPMQAARPITAAVGGNALGAGSKIRRLGKAFGIHVLPWVTLVVVFVPGSLVFASRPIGITKVLLHWALLFLTWGLFVPIIRVCLRKWPLHWPPGRRVAAVHLAIPLAIVLVHGLILTVSDAAGMFIYGPAAAPLSRRALAVLLYAGPMDLIIYSTVVACITALDAWARYHQHEQSIVQAQLDALRAQLEPHFLFNALNALSELVYRDPAAADQVISRLARLLRRLVDDTAHTQSLERELALLREYLSIQDLMLGDRLRVLFSVPDEMLEAQVPTLLLQPLFENAIRHGIAQLRQGGSISLKVSRDAGDVILRLSNEGPPRPEKISVQGVGLGNIRARLHTLYGSRHSITVDFPASGGGTVMIRLPFVATPA
jgi:two-component system LytT family sensor kinase